MEYYLYWYKLPEHTDPYKEGYIGITNDITRRKQQHKYCSNPDNMSYIDNHFYRAIRCYGGVDNLEFQILHSGTMEFIYAKETEYRPTLNVGWNIATGGRYSSESIFKGVTDRWDDSQKQNIGKHHKSKQLSQKHVDALRTKNRANPALCTQITLYHSSDPKLLYTFHSISEASRQLDIPLSRLKSKNLRKVSSYGNDGWAILFDSNYDTSKTPASGELRAKAIKQALSNKRVQSNA